FSSPAPPPPSIYTLSLHDALPILLYRSAVRLAEVLRRSAQGASLQRRLLPDPRRAKTCQHRSDGPERARILSRREISLCRRLGRSEEHTSELQSRFDLVCRLLLEK